MNEEFRRPPVVLLVEDDPGDQELTRRALADGVPDADLRVVSDGEEALDYLHQRGPYADPADAPRPDLVLLDLNMPKLDGREVLRRIAQAPSLQAIPIVMLTTSQRDLDIEESYRLGCSSFVTKPDDVDSLIRIIRRLGEYWFDLVQLPPAEHLG